jgi:hypothetical protein
MLSGCQAAEWQWNVGPDNEETFKAQEKMEGQSAVCFEAFARKENRWYGVSGCDSNTTSSSSNVGGGGSVDSSSGSGGDDSGNVAMAVVL